MKLNRQDEDQQSNENLMCDLEAIALSANELAESPTASDDQRCAAVCLTRTAVTLLRQTGDGEMSLDELIRWIGKCVMMTVADADK